MNDTSETIMSIFSNRSLGAFLKFNCSYNSTLSSSFNESAIKSVPTSIATTLLAPCLKEQSVNPPVDEPMSIMLLSFKSRLNESIAPSSFNPALDTYLMELLSIISTLSWSLTI